MGNIKLLCCLWHLHVLIVLKCPPNSSDQQCACVCVSAWVDLCVWCMCVYSTAVVTLLSISLACSYWTTSVHVSNHADATLFMLLLWKLPCGLLPVCRWRRFTLLSVVFVPNNRRDWSRSVCLLCVCVCVPLFANRSKLLSYKISIESDIGSDTARCVTLSAPDLWGVVYHLSARVIGR